MQLELFIDQLLETITRERLLLRRVARYVIPLLLFPVGFALAQMVRGWVGLVVGLISASILLVQIEVLLRPTLVRGRLSDRDIGYFFGRSKQHEPPSLVPAVPLIVPGVVALILSMALFLPTVLAVAAPWQRLVALLLGVAVAWSIWQRLSSVVVLLEGLEQRLRLLQTDVVPHASSQKVPISPSEGLLDPAISRRVAGLPLPPLQLSPAAQALLRVEAYIMLRDRPELSERDLREALNGLAQEAHADELRHWLLPPVGGKIYFPVAAGGVLATMLGATARRLGMDGAYSGSLGTWLIRLPPARSYRVAGRLIDALVALRLLPEGAVLPHHLTIQGNLGQEARVLSILHLASTPVIIDAKPDHARNDERPFIMRGGGVLDDMDGRGRRNGPRTDFVDGFLVVGVPDLRGVEHLAAHMMNLRIKQILAFGLQASLQPFERRSKVEQVAARAYRDFSEELANFLVAYDLGGALQIDWLDGQWSDVWPIIQRMNELKQHDANFLEHAQELRDQILNGFEQLAVAASGARRS